MTTPTTTAQITKRIDDTNIVIIALGMLPVKANRLVRVVAHHTGTPAQPNQRGMFRVSVIHTVKMIPVTLYKELETRNVCVIA